MKRKFIVGTGWKMNKTAAEAADYIETLLPLLDGVRFDRVDVFVLPPFTTLPAVGRLLAGAPVRFGGQNMHWETAGAWTGEISAPMLVETGCTYVELGHSERRYYFNETDEHVNKKVITALAHRLVPLVCIGETGEEKDAGQAQPVLQRQTQIALRGVAPEQVPVVVLAYEPRWAIGKAESASPEYVREAHAFIRACLRDWYGADTAEQTRVMYGGSVSPDNAEAIMAQPEVDGLFIGRAALDAQNFARLVKIVDRAVD